MNSKENFAIIVSLVALISAYADMPTITGVTAQQRYPWNGKVDITYTVAGDVAEAAKRRAMLASLQVTAIDMNANTTNTATQLSGDLSLAAGTHAIVWDMDEEGIPLPFKSSNVVFIVSCEITPARYCVVDLSGGSDAESYPVAYMAEPPEGGFNVDEYKTTKLVLRRIEPGSFLMNGQYDVTLTKPFFCGIFEVTQKQFAMVRSQYIDLTYYGDTRPMHKVAWVEIHGESEFWPRSTNVGPESFAGQLQSRTGLNFDLPTEAQWEYACRAGTTSAYNNGGDTENDLRLLGRYNGNLSDGRGGYSEGMTTVGSYQPNAWGLYDMHGNVSEWCLDLYGGNLTSGGIDPIGPSVAYAHGPYERICRGGSYDKSADNCFSSCRSKAQPGYDHHYMGVGFRLVITLAE